MICLFLVFHRIDYPFLDDVSRKKYVIVRARLQKEAGRLVTGITKPALDLNPFTQGVEIMVNHTSVTAHEVTPHETEPTIITVSDATRRRAESVINDRTIDPQWRTIIRTALELNDPWLAELVSRAEAGENIVDTFESMRTPDTDEDHSAASKIEGLAEIICRAGAEPTAALFVLMGTLDRSTDPKEDAKIAKHFAFSRCAELNLYGMVDTQIAVVEGELLASNTLVS